MLTSLVGARRNSTLPTGGTRPAQLQNRIRMKKAAKIAMYGAAWGPPIDMPKFEIDSYAHSEKFWTRPGMSLRRRPRKNPITISRPPMIHMVKSVELMPTAKVRILPLSGAVPITVAGAGNSKLPLMKQTGNSHAPLVDWGSKGGAKISASASTATMPITSSSNTASAL